MRPAVSSGRSMPGAGAEAEAAGGVDERVGGAGAGRAARPAPATPGRRRRRTPCRRRPRWRGARMIAALVAASRSCGSRGCRCGRPAGQSYVPPSEFPARTAAATDDGLDRARRARSPTPVARDSSGVPRAVGRSARRSPPARCRRSRRWGRSVGALASAATAPVRASSTTTPPESAGHFRASWPAAISGASAFSAEAWTVASREVTRSRPGTGSVRETTPRHEARARRRRRRCGPGVPRSTASYCCSRPARPTRSSATSAPSASSPRPRWPGRGSRGRGRPELPAAAGRRARAADETAIPGEALGLLDEGEGPPRVDVRRRAGRAPGASPPSRPGAGGRAVLPAEPGAAEQLRGGQSEDRGDGAHLGLGAPSGLVAMTRRSRVTTVAVRLSASGRPVRSRMRPRSAGTTRVRVSSEVGLRREPVGAGELDLAEPSDEPGEDSTTTAATRASMRPWCARGPRASPEPPPEHEALGTDDERARRARRRCAVSRQRSPTSRRSTGARPARAAGHRAPTTTTARAESDDRDPRRGHRPRRRGTGPRAARRPRRSARAGRGPRPPAARGRAPSHRPARRPPRRPARATAPTRRRARRRGRAPARRAARRASRRARPPRTRAARPRGERRAPPSPAARRGGPGVAPRAGPTTTADDVERRGVDGRA